MIVYSQNRPACFCVSESAGTAVKLAVQDLIRDLERVSGFSGHSVCTLAKAAPGSIIVGTLGEEDTERFLRIREEKTGELRGKEEHYLIQATPELLFLIGNDERGTIWALYEFSRRFLKVDPLYLFTDHMPAHQDTVGISPVRILDGPDRFRFRGWFINDEDLIMGFCRQGRPEKEYDFHRDYAPMLARIVETALRLKQNLLIPASHIDMEDPAQEALVKLVTDRGMFISMHHQEPVGVNQQRLDRWFSLRGDQTENINFADHPEKYREIWRHFIRKWAAYPHVIWQLGLRGRGDRPMWYQNDRVPSSVKARGALISRALQEQWKIISEETGSTDFLCTSTLWMEGMPLYRSGALIFPPGTMVILSDFGPDQMFGEEYYETPRSEGTEYGIYYHACFWGCGPHLVKGNRPEKIFYCYREAERMGDDHYSVLNVSNIREHVCMIAAAACAVWHAEEPDEPRFLEEYCRLQYGEEAGGDTALLYRQYFDSFPHLDDSRLPGRMLLMDGMLKRVALMLLRILSGEKPEKPDIQNKRLFDFPDLESFTTFYVGLTKEGAEQFERVVEEGWKQITRIPSNRQCFFGYDLLLQAETMLGLNRCVHSLCEAVMNGEEGNASGKNREVLRFGALSLRRILDLREKFIPTGFEHWWEGDTLVDISWLYEQMLRQSRGGTEKTGYTVL